MRRIGQYEFGPAENLRYEEAEDPVPGPGQVRVAVAASGVHLVDTAPRAQGLAPPAVRPLLAGAPLRDGLAGRYGYVRAAHRSSTLASRQ